MKDTIHSTLYVKDKHSIADAGYHELSMLSDLPYITQIKKLRHELNSHYDIRKVPGDIIGVQQSLTARLIPRLTSIVENATDKVHSCFRVKLTGDGTQIDRGLTVVNVAFTILEEGNKARSASGNHSIGIFKVSEDYHALISAMQDIITEAKSLKNVTINNTTYEIKYFLGGDMKFLALVCGIDSATCIYPCIWCKCPKGERHNMKLKWSITDEQQGARTVEEITTMSKLGKNNKNKYNCSHEPMFSFIPIQRVVIDTLHLFLRISDVLINLLIRDIRVLDATNNNKVTTNYMIVYQNFLNEACKIHFRFYTDKESKALKWRDLTGPEKKRLLERIDIPTLFHRIQEKMMFRSCGVTLVD